MTTLKEHGLFSSRDTLEEALQYGEELISARVDKDSRMEAFTAMHVVANTAIKLLAKASIKETIPYSDEDIDNLAKEVTTGGKKGYAIADLSDEECARLLRYSLSQMAAMVFAMAKMGLPFAQELTSYTILISRVFGLSTADLTAEIKDKHIIQVSGG
jgi:hypothetical protein